jgi:hypothetical protein
MNQLKQGIFFHGCLFFQMAYCQSFNHIKGSIGTFYLPGYCIWERRSDDSVQHLAGLFICMPDRLLGWCVGQTSRTNNKTWQITGSCCRQNFDWFPTCFTSRNGKSTSVTSSHTDFPRIYYQRFTLHRCN